MDRQYLFLRPLEDVSRGNTGKHGCQSEPCPSTRAQRTERPVARNGYYLRRVRTVSGRELPDTVRICTWNHGATSREAATKVQCAGKSLQRWVELCRPSKGRILGRNMRSKCRCSMCPAIHINSRSWLRSSSTHEPSDPPLKVVFVFAKSQARTSARRRRQPTALASLAFLQPQVSYAIGNEKNVPGAAST